MQQPTCTGWDRTARGIMDIVCAYEDEAREAVLATLEQVTGRPTMFAYRARRANGDDAATIICIGRSLADAGGRTHLLSGFFVLEEAGADSAL